MTQDNQDEQPLLNLFLQEAESHAAALTEGLVDWETNKEDLSKVETLMRAAHSLKGAAKIVGLNAYSQLAHALEDCFVATQKGEITLETADYDTLLKASDFLAAICDTAPADLPSWPGNKQAQYDELLLSLNSIAKSKDQGTQREVSQREVSVPENTQDQAQPKRASRGEAPVSGNLIKITATNLNRLMGLAAESLIETRRIQPLKQGLLQLKNLHNQLTDILTAKPEDLAKHISDNRQRYRDIFQEQLDLFDNFTRKNIILSSKLYNEILATRMAPFREGIKAFPRLTRDTARSLDKKIKLEISGHETPVDRDILEKLEAPLNQIIRNACGHGIETPEERKALGKDETGTITLEARHSAGMLLVSISDDGRGIHYDEIRAKVLEKKLVSESMAKTLTDKELVEFIFLPGFSTARTVTELSGRGVGMDVVQDMVQKIGGSIRIHSKVNEGTTFTFQLPITRSVIHALTVKIADEPYAFPLALIQRTLRIGNSEIEYHGNQEMIRIDDMMIPVYSASAVLGIKSESELNNDTLSLILLGESESIYAIAVQQLVEESELVAQALDPRLDKVAGISSASINKNGEPVLIIDAEDVINKIRKIESGETVTVEQSIKRIIPKTKKILVVDDSQTVRETEKHLLLNAGYEVHTAVDGNDALNVLRTHTIDLIVSDIDMPRMNGFELAKKIREEPTLKDIPVIIISYKDRPEDQKNAYISGADFYLTKSCFQDDTFINAVENLLK